MWTLDETQFIIDNYSKLGANKCSEILNKSKNSVRNKAHRLGLKSEVKKSGKHSYLTFLDSTDFILLEEFTRTSDLLMHRHTICGHEWRVRPNNIVKGQGCPNCGKVSKHTESTYNSRLKDTDFEALESINGVDKKILHRHKKCGHEWLVRPHDIMAGQNCPKCSKNNYSKIAIDWLNSLGNANILHAENGGEQSIGGYKVDGYDPINNIVYEFHGDAYHGNLDIFNPDDRCHPFNKTITADELFQATFEKMQALSEYSQVCYIWENDYRMGKDYDRFA